MGEIKQTEIDGLEKLVRIYLDLNDEDKGKIIQMGEGLLKSQKVINDNNIEENKPEN
jgi:hypothetical protein